MRRLAEFLVSHPWICIGLVLAVTMLFGLRIKDLEIDDTVESMFLEDDPDLVIYKRFLDRFHTDEFFVVAFAADNVYSPENLDLIAELTRRFESMRHVHRVVSLTNVEDIRSKGDDITILPLLNRPPENTGEKGDIMERARRNPFVMNSLVSEDGKVAAILAETDRIEGDRLYRHEITRQVRETLKEVVPSAYVRYSAGGPIFFTVYREYTVSDLKRFTPITIFILSILMFAIFRNGRSVWIPALCVLFSLIWTMGFIAIVGRTINLVTTVIPPLILVIGTAVVVHIMNRYNERLRERSHRREAMTHALERLLVPCFLTSLTTAIGFASLALSRIRPIRETGLFCAFGVLVTFLVSILLAPPLFMMLKRPPREVTRKPGQGLLSHFLDGIVKLNLRHPRMVIGVTAVLVALAVIGLFRLRIETHLIQYFKESSEVYRSYRFLETHLSGAASIEILVEGVDENSILEPEVLRAMEDTQRMFEGHPYISRSYSLADYVKMLNRAFHSDNEAYYRIPDSRELISQLLFLMEMSGGNELRPFVNELYSAARISARANTMPSSMLRELLAEMRDYMKKRFPAKVSAMPAGESVLYAAMEKDLVEGQLRSFSMAMVVIVLVIMIVYRSARVGLYSFLPNTIPILMTVGFMGFVGISINMATCMVPSIAIGIAVDDTIHFMSRFRSELREKGDVVAASQKVLATTGRAMTVTSVVLFFGFMVLLVSNFKPNMYFGMLTALTMIWALLGDLLFLPSLLILTRPKRF